MTGRPSSFHDPFGSSTLFCRNCGTSLHPENITSVIPRCKSLFCEKPVISLGYCKEHQGGLRYHPMMEARRNGYAKTGVNNVPLQSSLKSANLLPTEKPQYGFAYNKLNGNLHGQFKTGPQRETQFSKLHPGFQIIDIPSNFKRKPQQSKPHAYTQDGHIPRKCR
jgi:hypothetical protein